MAPVSGAMRGFVIGLAGTVILTPLFKFLFIYCMPYESVSWFPGLHGVWAAPNLFCNVAASL